MKEKIVAIHQPNFFPWLGYFYKIAKCDIFVILDNVDFQQGNNNSITNRTKIKCADKDFFLTISVKKNKDSKLIKDVCIDRNTSQIKKHLKTIQLNYAKANHFKETYPFIEKIFFEFENYELMSEANIFIIKEVCNWLNITTPIVKASELNLKEEDRNERIVEICKQLEGTHYFSGNGGKKYHDENLFKERGIEIKYTNFVHPQYQQVGTNFISGLSTLDTILNCGINDTDSMVKLIV